MPFNWRELTYYEQIELVLGNVDGLDEEERETVLAEWGEGDYSDSANPECAALAGLQQLAVNHTLAKQGRSLVPRLVRLAKSRGELSNVDPDG